MSINLPKTRNHIADPKEEQKPRTFQELETHFPFKHRLQNRYQSHCRLPRKSITINYSSLSNRIHEKEVHRGMYSTNFRHTTKQKNLPGAAIFLDFEKAFDTIEWIYLQKCLEVFNFGPQLRQWIRVFYSNISSCVLNNGLPVNTFP